MKLIDTHAHLTFPELRDDLEGVLSRAAEVGVTEFITIGTDVENNRLALELAADNEPIYATVGFHPHDAKDITPALLDEMKEQSFMEKVVAIGEIGLDYHYNLSPADVQKEIFRKQLEIAIDRKLPAVIHSREAFDDTMEIFESFGDDLPPIVVHCFGGNPQQAQMCINKGFYISFTGVVTFKNAQSARDAAVEVPPERLMVETDCPFMSPAPMRKQKVNEPALMVHTAAKLAEINDMPLEKLAEITTANTKRFFNI
ncbi:MAG: TatD family hydrolase [Sedimentisphaeraceae bacterium JB056]